MKSLLSARSRALALLATLAIVVIALGYVVARDMQRFEDDARSLYDRLAQGFEFIDELQFDTQEVRRIHLYALHTSDANRQLEYADQSRAADARVQRLLADRRALFEASGTRAQFDTFDQAWGRYLLVRDDVLGLILERSLPEGVALDEKSGTSTFNDVREAIADLKRGFESYAKIQVVEAGTRANRSMRRLALLVTAAIVAAGFGIYLGRRRATLEALLRSEAHKGSILQAVPDPIISTDARGRIIELNDAAERTFGTSRAEAIGARLEDVVLPAGVDQSGVISALRSASSGQGPRTPARVETTGTRQDGATFPMALAAVSHVVGRDRVWTVHLTDLTERRQAEEQLRRAKEAAEAATAAKSDFLATMSHELRTPLNGVIGIAELLQGNKPLNSQRELIRMLRSAATALLGLVSDILDYSRIEAGQADLIPVPFPVRQCIEDALDPITELAARKKLQVGWVIDQDVPAFVVADQDRVRQVLLNLLSNAVKFTDAGEVTVHVTAERATNDSVTVSVKVRDTGDGIPAHLHDKLFRRFSHLDPKPAGRPAGSGLGLPISQSLSHLLGGSLTVQSAPGQGSTFTLTFQARIPDGRPVVDPLDGSLPGVDVLACLGPGIVGRQIRSMLERWSVRIVEIDDAPASPTAGQFDAIVVDADGLEDRFDIAALKAHRLRSGGAVPVITATRTRTRTSPAVTLSDHVVGTPVRAHALHDALCLATGFPIAVPDWADAVVLAQPGSAELLWPLRSLQILLVDDNDSNRRVIRLMLEELGVVVDDVGSGLEAIAQARNAAYDVILMDVRMPDLDGVETTRRIRSEQRTPEAPPVILALTANVMQGEEARCRAAGMNGYLPKPLRLDKLAAALGPLAAQKAGSPSARSGRR